MWPPVRIRAQQRGRRPDPYMLLLMFQLAQQAAQLEHKPPVTLALILSNFAVFYSSLLPAELQQLVPSIPEGCLQPYAIFRRGDWSRLIWSAFLHADESHIYYNMASFLWKGAQLEPRMGSVRFAALVAELLALSHGLVLWGSWVLSKHIPEYRYLYSSTCSVGFSAVLFALKVVLNHNSSTYSNVMGMELPTKYLAWAELVLASLFNPQASFFGHLCGILAGLLHVWAARRCSGWLRAAARSWRPLMAANRQQQPRFAAPSGPAQPRPPMARHNHAAQAGADRAGAPASGQQHAAGRSTPADVHHQSHPAAVQAQGAESSAARAAPLSQEELRQRRLARFG